jgi:hypothetical protein
MHRKQWANNYSEAIPKDRSNAKRKEKPKKGKKTTVRRVSEKGIGK